MKRYGNSWKEIKDVLDAIFENKDNDNMIMIDKDMKQDLYNIYKWLWDWSELLKSRTDKAIEECDFYTKRLWNQNIYITGMEMDHIKDILRGEDDKYC